MQSKDHGGRLAGEFGSLLVRRFSVRQPEMFRVVETVVAQKLTSIDKAALCELAQTVMDLEFDDVEGDFLQAGCGAGGATIVIAHAKKRRRIFTVHDPIAVGVNADTRLNFQLITGPYDTTIGAEGALAFAHLDCGKYEPMMFLLERLAPRLVIGGQLVVDDYPTKEGCKRAVDEYFRGKSGFKLIRKSRLHIVRNP